MDSTAHPTTKTLVLGLGNAMLSDLGAGIEAIHLLRRRRPRPAAIDLLRVGLVNISLAEVIARHDSLIVVESRPVGGDPGSLVELQATDMDAFLERQTGDDAMLADIFGLLETDGRLPSRRALMVLHPASARVGSGLSRPVATALPRLVERVLERAEEWSSPAQQTPGAACVAAFHPGGR
jgi:hydrogenase maturation protease